MSAFDDAMRWVAKDNNRKSRERGQRERRVGGQAIREVSQRAVKPLADGTGGQWNHGSTHVTANPASDPRAGEQGYFVSVKRDGEKATALYDSEGNLIDFT